MIIQIKIFVWGPRCELDVYKRQGKGSENARKENQTFVDADGMQGLETVSYTHLDVYKRQQIK